MKHRYPAVVVSVVVAALGTGLVVHGLAKGKATRIATLSGSEEVPPADPDGSARAVVKIEDNTTVCFNIKWSDIGSPTKSHIHDAPDGENGPIVVTFWDQAAELPATFTGVRGCVENVSAELVADIKKNPEEYYVNVHNTEFPNGAIRGQLRKP